MPIDQQTRDQLTPIAAQLAHANASLQDLLVGAPVGPDAQRRIDVLQKVYAEVSNYDRHYSTTRSALTGLAVTVGLAAGSEPFKALVSPGANRLACPPSFWPSVIPILGLPFSVTFLLFLLAILINIQFQRLTYSCRLVEERIERKVESLMTGVAPAAPEPEVYKFRAALSDVMQTVSPVHFDAMAILLCTGVVVFCSLITAIWYSQCTSRWYWWPILALVGLPSLTLSVAYRIRKKNLHP